MSARFQRGINFIEVNQPSSLVLKYPKSNYSSNLRSNEFKQGTEQNESFLKNQKTENMKNGLQNFFLNFYFVVYL